MSKTKLIKKLQNEAQVLRDVFGVSPGDGTVESLYKALLDGLDKVALKRTIGLIFSQDRFEYYMLNNVRRFLNRRIKEIEDNDLIGPGVGKNDKN